RRVAVVGILRSHVPSFPCVGKVVLNQHFGDAVIANVLGTSRSRAWGKGELEPPKSKNFSASLVSSLSSSLVRLSRHCCQGQAHSLRLLLRLCDREIAMWMHKRRSKTIIDADLEILIVLEPPLALRKGCQCRSRPPCRRWRRRDHSVLPLSLLCL
ncbi:hypothetical protein FCV25MIE_29662, partial [Fagus crenata]